MVATVTTANEVRFEELANALNVSLARAMRYIALATDEDTVATVDYDRMTLTPEMYRRVIALNS